MMKTDIEIDPGAEIDLIESGISRYICFTIPYSKVTIKITEYQLKQIKSLI